MAAGTSASARILLAPGEATRAKPRAHPARHHLGDAGRSTRGECLHDDASVPSAAEGAGAGAADHWPCRGRESERGAPGVRALERREHRARTRRSRGHLGMLAASARRSPGTNGSAIATLSGLWSNFRAAGAERLLPLPGPRSLLPLSWPQCLVPASRSSDYCVGLLHRQHRQHRPACPRGRLRRRCASPDGSSRLAEGQSRLGDAGAAVAAHREIPSSDSAARAGGELLGPASKILGVDVLDVGGDVPPVPERVLELAGAVAVELVLHRP